MEVSIHSQLSIAKNIKMAIYSQLHVSIAQNPFKKVLVMSLIQCHFDYACSFWYPGLSQLLRNRLLTTQNKIIRYVLRMDSRSHIGRDVFKVVGWLQVSKKSRSDYS